MHCTRKVCHNTFTDQKIFYPVTHKIPDHDYLLLVLKRVVMSFFHWRDSIDDRLSIQWANSEILWHDVKGD